MIGMITEARRWLATPAAIASQTRSRRGLRCANQVCQTAGSRHA